MLTLPGSRVLQGGNLINPLAPINRGLMMNLVTLPNSYGGIWQDATGRGHNARLINSSWSKSSWPGGRGCIDCSAGWVSAMEASIELPLTGYMSLWWCPTSSSYNGGNHPIVRIASSGLLFDLYAYGGTIYGGWYNGGDGRVTVTAPSVTLGTWHHWRVEWIDGTGTTVYFDGTSIGTSGVDPTSVRWSTHAADFFRIGAETLGTYAGCLVDDFRIGTGVYGSDAALFYSSSKNGYNNEYNTNNNLTTFLMGGNSLGTGGGSGEGSSFPKNLIARQLKYGNLTRPNDPDYKDIYAHYLVLPQTKGGLRFQNLVLQKVNTVAANADHNHATIASLNSSCWTGPKGRPGGHGAFTTIAASGQYAFVGLIPGADSASKFSMGLWMYRPSNAVVCGTGFAASSSSGGNRFSIIWDTDDTLKAVAENGGLSYGAATLTGTGWHHVWIVYDGTQTGDANRLKLYVDSIAQTLSFTNTIPATLGMSGQSFYIGLESSGRNTTGSYDDITLMPGVSVTGGFIKRRMYASMTGYKNTFSDGQLSEMVPCGLDSTPPPPSVNPAIPHNIVFGRRPENYKINKAHPLARNLIACYIPFSTRGGPSSYTTITDLAGNYNGITTFATTTPGITGTNPPEPAGFLGSFGSSGAFGGGYKVNSLASSPMASGEATIIAYVAQNGSVGGGTDVDMVYFGDGSGASTNDIALINSGGSPKLRVIDSGGSLVTITGTSGILGPNLSSHIAGTVGPAGMVLYGNGQVEGTDANTTRGSTLGTKVTFNGGYGFSSAFLLGNPMATHALFFYNRQLSESEIKIHMAEIKAGLPSLLIRNNTWLPCTDQAPEFDPITGVSTFAFTGSAAISGSNALSGISDMVFGYGSTVLHGTGALVGECEILFGCWAALAGAGALAGNIAVQFTVDGNMVGAGGVSGTSALTFSASGVTVSDGPITGSSAMVMGSGNSTLIGVGSLSGAAGMVFGVGNVFLLGSGALTGNAIAQFSGTATAGASGTIAGSAATLFSSSAVLLGAGLLTGASNVVFGSGSTSLKGAGVLAGASDMVITSNPYLTGGGFTTGLATFVFGGSASIIASGTLGGASAIVLSGSAFAHLGSAVVGTSAMLFGSGSTALKGKGRLAGSSVLAFGYGASAVKGAGKLAGNSIVVFGSGSTSLKGAGKLTGNSIVQFGSGSTVLKGAGRLTGTSVLVIGSATSILKGTGRLAGASVLTIGASSLALHAKGKLAGTSVIQFTSGSSTLSTKGALGGVVAIKLAGTGLLKAKGVITGSAGIVFGGVNILKGRGVLVGAGSLMFTASAVGTSLSKVTGQSSSTFTASASMGGKGRLTGSAAFVLTASANLHDGTPSNYFQVSFVLGTVNDSILSTSSQSILGIKP